MKKAFDSVDPASVLEALKHQEIKETSIRLLDDIHKGCTGRIILNKKNEKFPIGNWSKTRRRHLANAVYCLSGRGIQEA